MATYDIDQKVINDLARLRDALHELDDDMYYALNFSLLKGARPALRALKATKEFKDKSGRLRKSAKITSKRRRGKISSVAVQSGGPGARHPHWIELGTDERYHKSGKWVGRIQPTRYVEKSVVNSFPEIWSVVLQTLNGEFPRAVNVLARKHNIHTRR